MSKYFLVLVSIFSCCKIFAQKIIPEFGKISVEELRLPSCSFESDAAAVKLFDVQETEFDYSDFDSKLKTERRVRIKIFDEKGYKYASIKIPYFSKKGVSKIKDLKGRVYNLDESGKIITQKLEKKIFLNQNLKTILGKSILLFPILNLEALLNLLT